MNTRRPVLLLSLALSACSSWGPRSSSMDIVPDPPVISIPGQWSQGGEAARTLRLVRWWEQFRDPQLTRLVERALANSTTVAAAEAQLRQARAERDLAGAGLASYVSASASAQAVQTRGIGTSNTSHAGLDASWEPDFYGTRRQALAAGEAGLRAVTLTLAEVQVSVAAEVALSYTELRAVQLRLQGVRAHLARLRTLQDVASTHAQDGAPALDRERVRTSIGLVSATLSQLEAARSQLTHAVAVLCGANPESLSTELALAPRLPEPPPDLALSLPADTLRQRADVRIAEARIDEAVARLGHADAARKPVVRLEGSIGLRGIGMGGSSSVLRALFGSVSGIAFDGGAGRAQVALEQGAVQASYAAYRAAVLSALQEVEDALSALAADKARQAALQDAQAAATIAAPLALQAYQAGQAELQVALDTQRMLFRTSDELLQAQAALTAGHIRLFKALGGGWQADGVAAP